MISKIHLNFNSNVDNKNNKEISTKTLEMSITDALQKKDSKTLNSINDALPRIENLDPTQPHQGPIQNPYAQFGVSNEEWFAFNEVNQEVAKEGKSTHLSHVFAFSHIFLKNVPSTINFPKSHLQEYETLTQARPSTSSLKTQQDWLASQDEKSVRHIYNLGTKNDPESLTLIKNTLTMYDNGAYLLEKLQERYALYGLHPSKTPSPSLSYATQLDVKG